MILEKKERQNLNTIYIFLLISLIPLFEGGFDNNIVYYLLILGLAGNILFFRDKDYIHIDLLSPIFTYSLFLFWAGLSFFWSIHYQRSLIEFFELSIYLLILIKTSTLNLADRKKTIEVGMLVASLIAALGILEYIFISIGRITSTFTNPNPFATYLLVFFVFSWSLYLRGHEKKYLTSSYIFILALLLSGSRGSYTALLVSLPFVFLGIERKDLLRNIVKTLVLLGLALASTRLLMYIAPIIQENLGLDLSLINNLLRVDSLFGSSSIGRFEFWKTSLRIFRESPLNGFGLGTFFASYFMGYGRNRWYSRFTHNHYLQILAELGLVGLILFSIFLISILYLFYNKYRKKEYENYFIGIIAAFVAFFSHIFIEFSWNFPGSTIIIFWMIGLSLDNSFKKPEKFSIRFKPTLYRLASLVLLLLVSWHTIAISSYKIGFNYEDNKELEKAERVYNRINTFYPINKNGYLFEANIHVSRFNEGKDIEDLKKAIEIASKGIRVAPYDSQIHNYLGGLYMSLGDLEKAEKHYILGKEYTLYTVRMYRDLAQFYIGQNRLEEAEEVLKEAIEIKDYAIIAVPRGEKDFYTFEASTIHVLLFDLYKRENRLEEMEGERKIILEMIRENEALENWYNVDMFLREE